MFAMLASGTVYGYGALASKVKDAFGFTEASAQLIGIMGNLGMAFGQFVGGVLVDRCGPRVTMLGAAVLLFAGYFLFNRLLVHSAAAPGVVALLWFTVGHGCGVLFNAAMFTSARNFGDARRGMVVGLLSSFFGAASTLFVSLLNACLGGSLDGGDCSGGELDGSLSKYMLLCAVVTPGFALLGALLSRRLPPEAVAKVEAEEGRSASRRLHRTVLLVVAVVAFVMAGGMLHAANAQQHISYSLWSPYALVGLLLLFALVPLRAFAGLPEEEEDGLLAGASDEDEAEGSATADTISVYVEEKGPAVVSPQLNTVQAVRTPEFWLLWVMCAGVMGANIMTLNMTSTIVKDRRIGDHFSVSDSTMGNVLVMTTMALSSVTRLGTGKCIWALPLPRVCYFQLSCICAVAAQVLWALSAPESAIAAAAVMGVSDGMVWTITPWLSGKMFGLKSNGGNFGAVICLSAVGWVLMTNVLEPGVYNHNAGGQDALAGSASGSLDDCYGISCFRATHLAAAGAAAASLAASVLLSFRLRRTFGQWV